MAEERSVQPAKLTERRPSVPEAQLRQYIDRGKPFESGAEKALFEIAVGLRSVLYYARLRRDDARAGREDAETKAAQLRARVAELEQEIASARRGGYQAAIEVMRQEKLPMSVGLLEAQLTLEILETPDSQPEGGYPPSLPWAQVLDADDLEGFLTDLADAATGTDDLNTLRDVEAVIGRWRVIADADRAHRTAPGPSASAADSEVAR